RSGREDLHHRQHSPQPRVAGWGQRSAAHDRALRTRAGLPRPLPGPDQLPDGRGSPACRPRAPRSRPRRDRRRRTRHTGPGVMELIAVNVGMPAPLPDGRTGRTVLSGIRKHRVGLPLVQVDEVNIEGDGQADLDNHGGVDKAVYCYSHDHRPAWMAEIGYGEARDAPFGENLSLRGATESDVQIGDRWQWGEAILEVAQPRWPCFKLGLHAGDPGLPARLIESERSGWYCRVIATGPAPRP